MKYNAIPRAHCHVSEKRLKMNRASYRGEFHPHGQIRRCFLGYRALISTELDSCLKYGQRMHLPDCQVDLAFRIGVKACGWRTPCCVKNTVLDVRSWDSDFKFRTAILNSALPLCAGVLAGPGVITQIL